MKKSIKDVSQREPRVVVEAFFSINGKDICKKEIKIELENLDKEKVFEWIEKERKKIFETAELQIPEGEYLEISFVKADIKESFLNPDLKVGDTILNKSFH